MEIYKYIQSALEIGLNISRVIVEFQWHHMYPWNYISQQHIRTEVDAYEATESWSGANQLSDDRQSCIVVHTWALFQNGINS